MYGHEQYVLYVCMYVCVVGGVVGRDVGESEGRLRVRGGGGGD